MFFRKPPRKNRRCISLIHDNPLRMRGPQVDIHIKQRRDLLLIGHFLITHNNLRDRVLLFHRSLRSCEFFLNFFLPFLLFQLGQLLQVQVFFEHRLACYALGTGSNGHTGRVLLELRVAEGGSIRDVLVVFRSGTVDLQLLLVTLGRAELYIVCASRIGKSWWL